MIFALEAADANAIEAIAFAVCIAVAMVCCTVLLLHDKWPFDWPKRKDGE